MKKKLFTIFGALLAIVILYICWRIYANTIGPTDHSFDKFLPPKVLTWERKEVTKRPNTNNRAVITAKGEEGVWLNGGYRAYYVTPGKLPFLRIHPERAPKEYFEQNKQTIEQEYNFMLSESSPKDKDFVFNKRSYKGYDYYLLGDPASDAGTKETATIFFPDDSVLVTIYFFNEGPEESKSDYKNTEEYIRLRDAFITQYIDFAKSKVLSSL